MVYTWRQQRLRPNWYRAAEPIDNSTGAITIDSHSLWSGSLLALLPAVDAPAFGRNCPSTKTCLAKLRLFYWSRGASHNSPMLAMPPAGARSEWTRPAETRAQTIDVLINFITTSLVATRRRPSTLLLYTVYNQRLSSDRRPTTGAPHCIHRQRGTQLPQQIAIRCCYLLRQTMHITILSTAAEDVNLTLEIMLQSCQKDMGVQPPSGDGWSLARQCDGIP